jgi:hypothetical protein
MMALMTWTIGILVALVAVFVAAELVIGRTKGDGDWWQ